MQAYMHRWQQSLKLCRLKKDKDAISFRVLTQLKSKMRMSRWEWGNFRERNLLWQKKCQKKKKKKGIQLNFYCISH